MLADVGGRDFFRRSRSWSLTRRRFLLGATVLSRGETLGHELLRILGIHVLRVLFRRVFALIAIADDLLGGELLLGRKRLAFDYRVRDLRREQADGSQSIIIAGDYVVHFVGIAIRVDDSDNRNAELLRF